MSDAAEIRRGLVEAARKREAAAEQQREATYDLRRLLREVQAVDGISMKEAAELAGISRVTAYELLKG